MTISAFGAFVPSFSSSSTGSGFFSSAPFLASAAGQSTLGQSLSAGNTLFSSNTLSSIGGTAYASAVNSSVNPLTAPGEVPNKPVESTPLGGTSNEAWTFIVAPEDISWDTAVAVNRVDMFGTNSPPVIVGTKGMRDLSLTNAMIEGFTRARTVEGRVLALEKLMRFTLNAKGGFINVPVYHVYANNKKYGGVDSTEGGYFVIRDVKIKETMRDFNGLATRAFADVSLVQVPPYQVDLGIDQASAKINKATSYLAKLEPNLQQQAQQASTAPAGSQGPPRAPSPGSGATGRRSSTPAGGGTSQGRGRGSTVPARLPTERVRF